MASETANGSRTAAPATGGPYEVEALEGIGPAYAGRLRALGVQDTRQLLAQDADALAARIGAPAKTIREWQVMADLVRVPGIGPQYAEALARGGVAGVADLVARPADAVAAQVGAYLGKLRVNVVGQPVTAPKVEAWQQAARRLARPPRPASGGKVAFQRAGPAPVAFLRPGEAAPAGPEPVVGTPMPQELVAGAGLAFEHVCCQAIRPNPFDPEVDAQGEEARKEPYLVEKSAIRPTAGVGVVVALMGLAGAGALAASLAGVAVGIALGAGVGGLLLVYLLLSFTSMAMAARNVEVEATRHVMEPVVERGKTFHVALDTQGSRVPASLGVVVSDLHSPGLRPVEPPKQEGLGRIEYTVRAQGRGLLTFKGIELRLRSRDRLWVQDQEFRYRTTIEVSPSVPALAFRARITGGALMPQNMPSHIIKLYKDVESEITRAFGPGDRLRDVDWKRAAISGQLVTRQRSQEGEQTVLLTIDCGQSMLQDQAGFRNLDLAVEYAQEFMEAGLRRNHEVGLLAFNEEEILDHVRPNRKKMQARRLSLHLRHAAGHHLPDDNEEPVESQVIGNPENLLVGLQHGIRQRGTSLLTMIVFTDLRTMPEEIAQGLARAAANGHRVVVMLLPPPKLRPVIPGAEASEAEEDEEKRGEEHTLRLRELLMGHGIQFLEIGPSDEDLKLDLPDPSDAPGEA